MVYYDPSFPGGSWFFSGPPGMGSPYPGQPESDWSYPSQPGVMGSPYLGQPGGGWSDTSGSEWPFPGPGKPGLPYLPEAYSFLPGQSTPGWSPWTGQHPIRHPGQVPITGASFPHYWPMNPKPGSPFPRYGPNSQPTDSAPHYPEQQSTAQKLYPLWESPESPESPWFFVPETSESHK
ncbi:hypothetical protein SAMN05444487_105135 [Marininema mesophilum]|uniref:Uncharacterized protein n=1 Tax=Marininema mesophilum TaxID=1048340 RepID=A0A1H2VKG5_9BACL|nr:hypothetical protein [Marininema mesophilum]SDW68740.1 hypothetical protein SAMN05444487_105135 [Marininema mesophilum]